MPRKRRISIAGAVHHVMALGIEGRDLFKDDEDLGCFLSLFEQGLTKTGFVGYAWVLMNNHIVDC